MLTILVGRIQHDHLPIMKEHNAKVIAPSSIKAFGGKYRDLPGVPVRLLAVTLRSK